MLGRLIGGFITVLVGVTLLPTIANDVVYAQNINSSNSTATTNLSSASSTITGLVTLFFALAILGAGVALTVGGLKDAGVL